MESLFQDIIIQQIIFLPTVILRRRAVCCYQTEVVTPFQSFKMATPEEELNGVDDEEQPHQKTHAAEASTDLEKITDYEEDKEISPSDIANAVSLIEGRHSEESIEKANREKELALVKIRKEDVDLIVDQMEISQLIAEKRLREHKGDVVEALVSLLE